MLMHARGTSNVSLRAGQNKALSSARLCHLASDPLFWKGFVTPGLPNPAARRPRDSPIKKMSVGKGGATFSLREINNARPQERPLPLALFAPRMHSERFGWLFTQNVCGPPPPRLRWIYFQWTFASSLIDRTVWLGIYCYNPIYHRGELKGKVLDASLNRDTRSADICIEGGFVSPASAQRKISLYCENLIYTAGTFLLPLQGTKWHDNQLFMQDGIAPRLALV